MYIAKLSINRVMKNVALYNSYESALSDVINGNGTLFNEIDTEGIDFAKPEIVAGGTNNLGFDGDFEFRYGNGITVYIGEPIIEDERRR